MIFFFFFFFSLLRKLEFIETEAVESNNRQPLVFSDDEEEKITDGLNDFIDNSEQPGEDLSFYRQLDPLNIDHYPKFPNQTRNGLDAIFEDDTPYYEKEDMRPELYTLEDFVNMLALKNLSKNLRP